IPGNAKLSHTTVAEIRSWLLRGASGKLLAIEYGVSRAAISLVHTRSTWRSPAVHIGMHEALSALRLIGNKHIPEQYLHSSEDQRKALLQGLMDTDGTISPAGYAEFCSTNRALASG